MSIMRRRFAGLDTYTSGPILTMRDAAVATATDSAAGSNPTISPYHNGLTGVNQTVNMLFKDMLWWSLGILALTMLTIRLMAIAWTKLRQVSAMSSPGDKQTYWKFSQWSWMPSIKNHLIYAPLWNKRHNREIRLSSAISIGTLPSRFHFILLGLYFSSNFVYMFVLNWNNTNKWSFYAEVRGRSGTLAAVNMIPLIIMAGRNNPLIGMLTVSFDTYNLLHRWMGRMVVIETIIHTIAWAVVQIADGGWESVGFKINHDSFIASGMVGTAALVILVILSLSPLRHAFYETFLNVHIILALIVFVCTWVHCATAEIPGGLPQLPWMVAIFLLWFADRFARMLRLVYYNWSRQGFTEASIVALPCEATRVTLFLPRHVEIRPGTHAYLRFRDVKAWENHPFSVAYVSHHPRVSTNSLEKDDIITREDIQRGTTAVSFIIGAHTGFTRALFDRATLADGEAVRMKAAMEGPYAGHHQLDSYGHAVMFCGSTGITHQLSYLKPLIEGYNDGTIATRRITLVWVIREFEALEWIRPWMNEILRMDNRRDILQMQVFVTRPKNPNQIQSPSSTVKVFSGRPNIMTIVKKEVEQQVGAMCVTVCGPGALADDVREAVREVQHGGSVVDFVEESFTW
ncbi:Ferric/cupric reductase transmembrane component 7 [Apiospora saccharicola]|uniref:Ferric/cupric reductase transmembrane component 7 n=1 Tax=Apiospora saccharicola TaxID=335842 RepID=A0ABR1VCD4_9PEZI